MSRDSSIAVAVRVPQELYAQAVATCGGRENLSEWLRHCIRRACGVRLGFEAGYEEGKMQGWADASRKFREAMKGATS